MVVSAFVALLIGATACDGGSSVMAPPPGGGGTSNLIVSNSIPPTANGTLTATATLTVDKSGNGLDELDVLQTVSGTEHEAVVRWTTITHVIDSTLHKCGNGGAPCGITQCVAGVNTCDPTKITLDFVGHKVTFTGLVLDDPAPGGTGSATLTGTLAW